MGDVVLALAGALSLVVMLGALRIWSRDVSLYPQIGDSACIADLVVHVVGVDDAGVTVRVEGSNTTHRLDRVGWYFAVRGVA